MLGSQHSSVGEKNLETRLRTRSAPHVPWELRVLRLPCTQPRISQTVAEPPAVEGSGGEGLLAGLTRERPRLLSPFLAFA